MNLPRTKAWWRSQAEHRAEELVRAIRGRNTFWTWLGKCWDQRQRLEHQIAGRDVTIAALRVDICELKEDIEAREHLLVEREERIAELEERLRIVEQENATMTTTIESISAGITWGDGVSGEVSPDIARLERELAREERQVQRMNGINSALRARLDKLEAVIRAAWGEEP